MGDAQQCISDAMAMCDECMSSGQGIPAEGVALMMQHLRGATCALGMSDGSGYESAPVSGKTQHVSVRITI